MGFMYLALLFIATQVCTTYSQGKHLPKNLLPEHYDLSLNIDQYSDKYSGVVKIRVLCVKETSNVVFNANLNLGLTLKDGIKITELVGDQETSAIPMKDKQIDEENELVTLEVDGKLLENQRFVLTIEFEGTITDKMTGIIKPISTEEETAVVSNFERNNARQAFPCFDDISMRAAFKLTIRYKPSKQDVTVISNKKLSKDPELSDNDWIEATFDVIHRIAPYQLSFAVLDMQLLRHPILEQVTVKLTYYGRMSQTRVTIIDYPVLNNIPKFIKEYLADAKFLYIDFIVLPFKRKIDIIKPGLIIKTESDIKSEIDKGQKYASKFVAEQLLKTFLGGTSVPKSLSDKWLLDALAKYISYFQLEPEQFNKERLLIMLSVMEDEAKTTARSLSNDSDNEDNLEQKDSLQNLNKGLAFLFTLDSIYGKDKMIAAINDMIRVYTEVPVDIDSFGNVLQASIAKKKFIPRGIVVNNILQNWVHTAGYPVVHIRRIQNEGTMIDVNQSRFFGESVTPTNECFWIPLTWEKIEASKRASYSKNWLGCKSMYPNRLTFENHNDDTLLYNKRFSGLYRVNYDEYLWDKIQARLNKDYSTIHSLDKALLINDALALAYTTKHSIDLNTAFKLVSYIQKEDFESTEVWLSFFKGMEMYKRTVEKSDFYKTKYLPYIKFVISNAYNKVFPTDISLEEDIKHNENIKDYELKILLHKESCSSGEPVCKSQSRTLYDKFMDRWELKRHFPQNPKSYPRELFSSVLCTVIASDPKEARRISTIENVDVEDRKLFYEAMACSKENWVLHWCIGYTEKPYKETKSAVFEKLLRGPDTFEAASLFFIKEYKQFIEYYRLSTEQEISNPIPKFIKTIACETRKSILSKLRELLKEVDQLRSMITEEELIQCELRYNKNDDWLFNNAVNLEAAFDLVMAVNHK